MQHNTHYDLIVIGGGLSGVAAAVSAKRQGLNALLVERMGCLGGAMAHCSVYPFMRHALKRPDGSDIRVLSAGIFAEMCRRHREIGGASAERGWQPELFKIILDDMVREAGVDVLFHTQLIGAVTEGRRVKTVRLAAKSEILEMSADFFIDASGDGDLIAFAGCDFQMGRESDNLCQPMTTCFRLGGVDLEKYHEDKPRLQEIYKQWQAEGKLRNPREDILTFEKLGEGILHLNSTRVIKHDATDAFSLSAAEIEARRQVLELYQFLCANSEAFANSFVISIAPEIGVRESRKLRGVHVLTAEEMKNCVDFEDSVALGNYKIDIHNPEGGGTYIVHFGPDEYYRIPYRSLLPKETDNLLVAGRCLSAEHEAHSAVRIMPICACLGEAAGIAAAEALHTGKTAHTLDVAAVQATLVANGAQIH